MLYLCKLERRDLNFVCYEKRRGLHRGMCSHLTPDELRIVFGTQVLEALPSRSTPEDDEEDRECAVEDAISELALLNRVKTNMEKMIILPTEQETEPETTPVAEPLRRRFSTIEEAIEETENQGTRGDMKDKAKKPRNILKPSQQWVGMGWRPARLAQIDEKMPSRLPHFVEEITWRLYRYRNQSEPSDEGIAEIKATLKTFIEEQLEQVEACLKELIDVHKCSRDGDIWTDKDINYQRIGWTYIRVIRGYEQLREIAEAQTDQGLKDLIERAGEIPDQRLR
ncbi:hypothetical protein GGR57DRAFT_499399 [Xylariaceae sp. FL1272]|nr:hypothetical protein GGR57DRAFT_499399 [Xylariaceae sp. FL1272]